MNQRLYIFDFCHDDVVKNMQILEKISDTSSIQTYRIKVKRSVKDILTELGFEERYFAVLVNGRKASLHDIVDQGAEILILPKLAGG